ncbi:unnamed protein product [Lasius platythorax]|uniref:Uncharacterized protein n=1 Tax=Lasius platythorax TaxID=488582 RepID=A0AAV2NVK9_9HYME
MENAGQTKVVAILQILGLRMIGGNEGQGKKEREQSKDTKVKQTSPFLGKFALREQEIVVGHDAGVFFPSLKNLSLCLIQGRAIANGFCLERDLFYQINR